MSPKTAPLAHERGSVTGHSVADWESALVSARTSLTTKTLSQRNFELLARASASPGKLTVVARLVYQYAKARPESEDLAPMFFDAVNASPFSLADWIDAIDFFHSWLQARQRKIELLPMIKYLECCVAAPEANKSGQTLKVLVADMLEVFDYEAG